MYQKKSSSYKTINKTVDSKIVILSIILIKQRQIYDYLLLKQFII